MSFFSKLFGGKRETPGLTHPMDLHAFADRYAAALRQAWPQARLSVAHGALASDTRIDWSLDDGFRATNFLGNSYQRYLDAPESLEEVFADQVAAARESLRRFAAGGASEEHANTAILPVLKTRGWHEVALQQARSIGNGTGIAFIVEPLAGDLVLTYVEDKPDSMSFLSPEEAERRGLDGPELRELALRNLTRFLPELQLRGDGGRYAARLDRNYDASMVLLFDRWREGVQVRGEPVFAIAARDELLVCGSEDRESLQSLREIAGEISQASAYNLSRDLYVFRDGGLQVLAD